MRFRLHTRPAASVVEFAVVAPITFTLLLGVLVGGMGICRYQQIAALARESSRWASVRGAQYAKDTGNPAATATDVYNNVISQEAVSLDLSQLNYTVTWTPDNTPVTGKVKVTITYQWLPEVFLGGITLSSTSETVMSN
jgi:Flp pilus assembly protein TadG